MTTTKSRYRAALIILESLVERGVKLSNAQDDKLFRIVIESVKGNTFARNATFRNFGFVFEAINDILSGKVCNICCDPIDLNEQHGEPVCFHCWMAGHAPPKLKEKVVRERV